MRQWSEQVRERFKEIGEEALSPLSEAERQQLLELLHRLMAGPIGERSGRSTREVEMLLQRLVDDH
jgi:hypothetical protein